MNYKRQRGGASKYQEILRIYCIASSLVGFALFHDTPMTFEIKHNSFTFSSFFLFLCVCVSFSLSLCIYLVFYPSIYLLSLLVSRVYWNYSILSWRLHWLYDPIPLKTSTFSIFYMLNILSMATIESIALGFSSRK